MAHPDPKRGGSEKGQRQHAGQTSRYSDLGMKDHSQHGGRGGEATPRDDVGAQASASHSISISVSLAGKRVKMRLWLISTMFAPPAERMAAIAASAPGWSCALMCRRAILPWRTRSRTRTLAS